MKRKLGEVTQHILRTPQLLIHMRTTIGDYREKEACPVQSQAAASSVNQLSKCLCPGSVSSDSPNCILHRYSYSIIVKMSQELMTDA